MHATRYLSIIRKTQSHFSYAANDNIRLKDSTLVCEGSSSVLAVFLGGALKEKLDIWVFVVKSM